MDKIKVFYCYPKHLKKELLKNGFQLICEGYDKKNNRFFWVFYLNKYLSMYLDARPSRKELRAKL